MNKNIMTHTLSPRLHEFTLVQTKSNSVLQKYLANTFKVYDEEVMNIASQKDVVNYQFTTIPIFTSTIIRV